MTLGARFNDYFADFRLLVKDSESADKINTEQMNSQMRAVPEHFD